jgi:hypothetical protein
MTIEGRRIAAYRAARICEPNMDQFAGAMAVYKAAFPEAYTDDAETIHALLASAPVAVPAPRELMREALRQMLLARGWRDVGAGCLQHDDDGNVSGNELGCVELVLMRAGYLTDSERAVEGAVPAAPPDRPTAEPK